MEEERETTVLREVLEFRFGYAAFQDLDLHTEMLSQQWEGTKLTSNVWVEQKTEIH